jgi:hypothetical protein
MVAVSAAALDNCGFNVTKGPGPMMFPAPTADNILRLEHRLERHPGLMQPGEADAPRTDPNP